MSSMESLDKLQAELSENVYGDAFHTLYNLTIDASIEHAELMAQAMRYVRKEKVEPLEAENVKLRKFMSDILIYGYGGGFLCSDGGWSCPHYQECFNCPIEEGPEKYVRRGCRWLALARELGVETSE